MFDKTVIHLHTCCLDTLHVLSAAVQTSRLTDILFGYACGVTGRQKSKCMSDDG